MAPITSSLKAFWRKAYEDNLTGLASMVAYSLLLSIFPLSLIALFVAGQVLGSHQLQASVLADAERLFPSAAKSTLVEGIQRLRQSSTTVGITALVSALWVGASFWGALDTAFCRIYRLPCRSWVRQKLFGFGMLAVILLFIAASVAVPTLQALLASSAKNLPFGLSHVRSLVYWLTILGGLLTLFAMLCVTYFAVPNAVMPWSSVWPGALGATVAMGIVDIGFPLYLTHVSTLRIGSSAVFALIALLWFYILALVLMAGAVINELRLERRRASAAARVGDVEWPRRRLRRPSATAPEVAAPATGAEAQSPE